MPNNKVLTADARAAIMDACQSISSSADALKECHTVDGDWGDDIEAKAHYEAELRLLDRLTNLLATTQQPSGEVTDEQIADMFERVTGYSIENGRAALNDADILGFARELLDAARAGEAS